MKLDDDDFTLFGLPPRFGLDRAALDARWRVLQAEVHPDRFAADGASAQRVAMQWAVRVNGAYRRLKDPLARGIIRREDVLGDLHDIVPGRVGRRGPEELTLFKNGGGAHLDLMTGLVIPDAWAASNR